jgi:hypothetical protein
MHCLNYTLLYCSILCLIPRVDVEIDAQILKNKHFGFGWELFRHPAAGKPDGAAFS